MWQTIKSNMQQMPSQMVPFVKVWKAPRQSAERVEKSIGPRLFMPLSRIVFPNDPSTIIKNRRMLVFAFSVVVEETLCCIFAREDGVREMHTSLPSCQVPPEKAQPSSCVLAGML